MTAPASEAVNDALLILHSLDKYRRGVAIAQVQYSAYLSCLLSMFDGNAVSEWGYSFVATSWGTPYSPDLSDVLSLLQHSAMLHQTDDIVTITEKGAEMAAELENLESVQERRRYLEAACMSLLAVPTGTLRDALEFEPTIRSAELRSSSSALLDEAGPAISDLHNQFQGLKQALGDETSNLFIPSMVWINFLLNQKQVRGVAVNG